MGFSHATTLGAGVVLIAPNAVPGSNGLLPSYNTDGSFAGWVAAGGINLAGDYDWTGAHTFTQAPKPALDGGTNLGDITTAWGEIFVGTVRLDGNNVVMSYSGSVVQFTEELTFDNIAIQTRQVRLGAAGSEMILRNDEGMGPRTKWYMSSHEALGTAQVESPPGSTLILQQVDAGNNNSTGQIILNEDLVTLGGNNAAITFRGDMVPDGDETRNLGSRAASLAAVYSEYVHLGPNDLADDASIYADSGATGRLGMLMRGTLYHFFWAGNYQLRSSNNYITFGPTSSYPHLYNSAIGVLECRVSDSFQVLDIAGTTDMPITCAGFSGDSGANADSFDIIKLTKDSGAQTMFQVKDRDGVVLNTGNTRYLAVNIDGVGNIYVGNNAGFPSITAADSKPLHIQGREDGAANYNIALTCDATPSAGVPLVAMYTGSVTTLTTRCWDFWHGGEALAHGTLYFNNNDYTPTGTTQVVDFTNGNVQDLDCGSATGDLTVTITPPAGNAELTLFVEMGVTPRDITWAVTGGSISWIETEPTWNGATGVYVIKMFWRNTNSTIYAKSEGFV